MIQIIGYMIVAYGVARLVQTTIEAKQDAAKVFGFLGIAALFVLAIMLTQQGNAVSGIGLP